MIKEIRPALVLLVALTAITGLVYPLAMTGVAQTLFPYQAQGSLLHDKDGKVIGSALIGQSFADARYFHGRPVGHDGARPEGPHQDGADALRGRQFRGLEPRADQQGAGRPRPG